MSTQNTETSPTQEAVPPTDTFDLTLDRLYRGDAPVVTPCTCSFHYVWDFGTNMGVAELQSIDGTSVPLVLNPIGIAGHLDFMSSQGTTCNLNGKDVTIRLVVLHIDLATGARSAGIMFNEDGSVVQTTENFDRAKASGLA